MSNLNTIDEAIAILQAVKEGKQVQAWSDVLSRWVVVPTPLFNFGVTEYRVKPKTIKWRPFMCKFLSNPHSVGVWYSDNGTSQQQIEGWCSFVRWLGDEQEAEV